MNTFYTIQTRKRHTPHTTRNMKLPKVINTKYQIKVNEHHVPGSSLQCRGKQRSIWYIFWWNLVDPRIMAAFLSDKWYSARYQFSWIFQVLVAVEILGNLQKVGNTFSHRQLGGRFGYKQNIVNLTITVLETWYVNYLTILSW